MFHLLGGMNSWDCCDLYTATNKSMLYSMIILYNIVFMNSVLRMFVHGMMLNGEVLSGDQQGCRRGFRKHRFYF